MRRPWHFRPAATVASWGANERISIGIIGCGNRGQRSHMAAVYKHAEEQNLEVTAVCDPWKVRREEAADRAARHNGREPRQFASHRELIALQDVDAVMIASPDHLHTTQLQAAARAGKDAYCEKPLGMELDKLKSACDAVREEGVVFQAGTQLRSYSSLAGCRELYRKGVLGTVSRIEQRRNGNRPYWYKNLQKARAEDVAWKEFLDDRPHRPFSADQFTCPDHAQALWIYPEWFMVSFSTNFGNGSGNSCSISGDRGELDLLNWNAPTISGKGVYPGKKTPLGSTTNVQPVPRTEHFLDWFQCLRTRNTPHAAIDAGYQHGVAVIMAQLAWKTGRRQVYDQGGREIREG